MLFYHPFEEIMEVCKVRYAGIMNASSEKLTPMEHMAQNRCFGCGPANAIGLRLEFLLAEDKSVVCLPTIPDCFEGPHGLVHGGIIATLLDEADRKNVV